MPETIDPKLLEERLLLYEEAHTAASAIADTTPDDFSTISFNLGKLYMLAETIYSINHKIEGR